MSQDWKRRLDEGLAEEQQREQRKLEEARQHRLEFEAQNRAYLKEAERRSYARQLEKHERRFRCCIKNCPSTSDGPHSGQWNTPLSLIHI